MTGWLTPRGRGWLAAVARLVLAGVWAWAGWAKLADPNTFLRAIRAYDATPEWLSKAIAFGLPVLELSLAAWLLVGIATRAAAALSGALLVVFLVGTIQAAARGLRLDCGCFGGGGITTGPTSYTLDILRDVGLLLLAGYLVWWPLSVMSVDAWMSRKDTVAPLSAKRMRIPDAQRKYASAVAARRRQRRIRSLYVNSGMALVVILVVLIAIGVQSKRAQVQGTLTATNASTTTGITVGKSSAPAKVVTYEDFQCPVCNNLEQTVGPQLTQLISQGKAQVQYHPVAFLDASSNGNRYSSRAANAAICASDISPDAFAKYHAYLYGKDSHGANIQPAEGSGGRTNQQLIDYLKAAIPTVTATQQSNFASCVTTEEYKALVAKLTDNASKQNINAVPTVLVNGKKLANPLTELIPAINAAQKG